MIYGPWPFGPRYPTYGNSTAEAAAATTAEAGLRCEEAINRIFTARERRRGAPVKEIHVSRDQVREWLEAAFAEGARFTAVARATAGRSSTARKGRS